MRKYPRLNHLLTICWRKLDWLAWFGYWLTADGVDYARKWWRVYPKSRWVKLDNVVKLGFQLTAVLLGVIVVLAFSDTCDANDKCKLRIVQFWHSTPNEIGDSLAGVAGALAFLWIIVTVFLQSKELAAQRMELRLTRQEFKLTRVETGKMAEAMEAQTNIFLDEQIQRKQQSAGTELDQLLDGLRKYANQAHLSCAWFYSAPSTAHSVGGVKPEITHSIKLFSNDPDMGTDEFVFACSSALVANFQKIQDFKDKITQNSENIHLLVEMKGICLDIRFLEQKLGSDQIIRLKNLDIAKLDNTIRKMIEAKIWAGDST